MKKIFLIFAIFFSIALFNLVSAQKVGYKGKRFLVNFDTKIGLEFKDNDIFEFFLNPMFNFSYSPGVEYIISKNRSIGLTVNYFRDDFDITYSEENFFDLPFNCYGVGIFYKKYLNFQNSYYQAPFGIYMNIKFDYMKYYLELPAYVNDHFVYGGRFEMGVDYLVFDRIRLSWGVSLGLSSALIENYFDDINALPSLTVKLNNEFSARYGFQHKFGIGILLF